MKSYFYKMSTLLAVLCSSFLWANDTANMSEGEYLARAGDCMACHTNDENKPYAGGHGLVSPIGTIYATNITPDKTYGIGNYTYKDFEQALRHGEKPSGDPLYPAMPFVSYAKMNDADVRALYDYFMNEVQPIAEPNLPTDIEWPLNMRFPMSIWIALLTDSREYIPQPDQSDEWNRGAYLVQGLGHCGSCHAPRSMTLVEQGLDETNEVFLSGAQLGGWYAPNLRTLREDDDQELFHLLKEPFNAPLVYHCSAGKDRTGLASALILYSLGVNKNVIYQDYLQSNIFLEDKYANYSKEHPNLTSLFMVTPDFLEAAIDAIKENYGSISQFIERTLNVDTQKLKELYLY